MEEVAVLLLVALSIAIRIDAEESILEFGAVGDGKTLNTLAFQNAIFYLKSFTNKGGAQLYVPPGKWLTGSFSLTSHLTLFLEKRCCHSWISGDNGTIDGQGYVWWDWFESDSLNYSRPHLVEFTSSDHVLVSNITFLNAPAYSIHPVYCSLCSWRSPLHHRHSARFIEHSVFV
ncbi:hypothetical protein OIU76_014385 [Salix suchowensis]|nr:hypothetical protein OIU76_014385 [Salix suchowensis]